MSNSVLDAIKDGNWDFEPDGIEEEKFDSTQALPGTDEKLDILADRIQAGLPLWHPDDRQTFNDADED